MDELSDEVHARVVSLCRQGDILCEKNDFAGARQQYAAALRELPQPWQQWEATTWTLTAIGDTFFNESDYDKARLAFQDAVHCPGGLGNPYIHLRLGQTQFELGDLDRAADELTRAYMGDGKTVFESQAPKYFAFLTTKLREPIGGW